MQDKPVLNIKILVCVLGYFLCFEHLINDMFMRNNPTILILHDHNIPHDQAKRCYTYSIHLSPLSDVGTQVEQLLIK